MYNVAMFYREDLEPKRRPSERFDHYNQVIENENLRRAGSKAISQKLLFGILGAVAVAIIVTVVVIIVLR
jgi:hypothetical protein